MQDRTRELQRATGLLQEKNEVFKKMNEELEAFAYISSHDLQEPLRKIRTFLSRMAESEKKMLTQKGLHAIDRIDESARHVQALIQDLLTYSRMRNTRNLFAKANLNALFEEVTTGLKEMIAECKATITAEGLREAVVIPFQFRQLLQNLIMNSLKFSVPDRPPCIRIECKYGYGSEFQVGLSRLRERYLHICVADNGIGFDSKYNDKIFEVFQRLHKKDGYSGTGIGLAIVKKIVDNHQGIIVATGRVNSGATFDIYLPVGISDTFSTHNVAG